MLFSSCVVDADSPLLHFLSKVMVLDVEMFGSWSHLRYICNIAKIRLRVAGRAIIHLNNFPLEPNQLAHHQIFPTPVALHTAASIGRVMQPYHFTVMLVVVHVVLKKNKKA